MIRPLALIAMLAAPLRASDTPEATPPAPAPVPTADHVRIEAAGREWSGWSLTPSAGSGFALLTDDGKVAVLPRTPAPKNLETIAQPVSALPTAALAAGLAHKERSVRDRCEELLVEQGARALPALDAPLSHPSPDVRRRALSILAELAPANQKAAHAWLNRTRDRLHDGDELVRREAIAAYAAIGAEDLRECCEDALRFDDAIRVRHEAIVTLGRIGDVHSIDLLLEQLPECEERSLRLVTFDALHRISGKNFGRDEGRWRNWWQNHRSEIVPENAR